LPIINMAAIGLVAVIAVSIIEIYISPILFALIWR